MGVNAQGFTTGADVFAPADPAVLGARPGTS